MVINNYLKSNSEVRQIIDEVMKKHGFRHHYQVAEYFGITAQTLSGWFKNNSIPHKHLLTIQNDLSSQNDGKNNEILTIFSTKFWAKTFENLRKFAKFWKLRSREEYGACRSRQALSSGALVAKFGFDTAENEPSKVQITWFSDNMFR